MALPYDSLSITALQPEAIEKGCNLELVLDDGTERNLQVAYLKEAK